MTSVSSLAEDLDHRNGNSNYSFPDAKTATTSCLSTNLLLEVFSWLNYSDLIQCRLVSKRWNSHICKASNFLRHAVFPVSLHDESLDILSSSKTPWTNISLCLCQCLMEHPEEIKWHGIHSSMRQAKSLHLHSSFLYWTVVQCITSWTLTLEELSIDGCVLGPEDEGRSIVPMVNHLDTGESREMIYAKRMRTLKELRVTDKGPLENLNRLLNNLIRHWESGCLESFHVLYDPSETGSSTSIQQATLFHALVLDIFRSHREDFQLTPYLSEEDFVYEIQSHSSAPMLALIDFFIRHEHLKTVAFPHFNNCSSSDLKRRRILRSLPKTVETLSIPGHSYLVPDFLSYFPNLKSISIGSIAGKPFHPNSYRYTPSVCKDIRELGVFSRIHLSPGKLGNFAWKFPSLTKLEFNAFRSVVNDFDLQNIVGHCRLLRHLSITGCDLISDFGFTGSPSDWCKETFRLGIIHSHPPQQCPIKNNFKPLAALKGLRSLLLRGYANKISDVGIYYGIRFQQLKTIWVPYSERITGWSLKELGRWNPSLEAVGMTASSLDHCKAIEELTAEHPRMSSDGIVLQSWSEPPSPYLSSPSMLTAIVPGL
ncbi:unnamed protein product [Allacma fusca]|uniref:F-box domain-containing protein n=1 Tax=Allacma fusca TaxID=39272 RepID=A0A8J2NJ25_9HEXA|nr:unnamed protein product [Allacma fusca]